MLLAVLKDSDSPPVVRTGVVVDDSGIVSNFDAIFAFLHSLQNTGEESLYQ